MFLGLPDPPVRCINPDPAINMQKNCKKNFDSYCWATFILTFLSLENDVNVPSKSNKHKNFFFKFFCWF
jgi:hypothetical protein